MKIDGADKLIRQLGKFPKSVRKHITDAVHKSVEDTARVARTLVPVESGQLKGWIHTEFEDQGLTGSVEAAPRTKAGQTKAFAVEFGRGKGNRGTTEANPYIRRATAVMAKRNRGRIKRAINKAARETFNG